MFDVEGEGGAAGQGVAPGRDPRAAGLVDLVTLWHAAGRPRGHSPRQWDRNREQVGEKRLILKSEAGGPNAEAWAPPEVAVRYALHLDPGLLGPIAAAMVESLRREPGRAVLEVPSPLMAALALGALAGPGGEDGSPSQRVIKGAVVASSQMDPWKQEVAVCEVQRAVADAEFSARQ